MPSSIFPETIEYDVSILTGDPLPNIFNHSRGPKIIGWGDYRDALDGHFAFAMNLSVRTSGPGESKQSNAFESIQKVVVEGTEYLWDRKSRTQSAALLWRAMHDGSDMEGLSGSVLCLGQPTDDDCRVVALKHFEIPICPLHSVSDSSARGDISWSSLKGGFLLPPEIRRTEIICESHEASAIPSEEQTWDVD